MKSTLYHPMDTIAHLQGQVLIDEVVVNVNDMHLNKNVPFLSETSSSAGCSSSSTGRGSSSSHSGSMAVDDLEYHITFPPAPNNRSPHHFDHKVNVTTNINTSKKIQCNNNKNAANGDGGDGVDRTATEEDRRQFVRERDGEMEPVVVLLGWYGCQDKHLAKYSKIYEDLGCITIRFLPKADIIIYQPDSLRSIASKLFEVVDDFNLKQHQVILHIFSNGGCYVYRHMCELLTPASGHDEPIIPNGGPLDEGTNNQPQPQPQPKPQRHDNSTSPSKTLRIEGCIFDSCPAVTSPLHLFRAIAAATTRGNLVYRWLRSMVLMFAVIFAAVMEFLLGFVWSESRRISPQALWSALAKDRSRCPQLFLYSKADEICHYKSIKNFAEERRKCGVEVSEVCWEDSPHVKHFLMHRTEYVQHVLSFVATCLHIEVHTLHHPAMSQPVMTSVDLNDQNDTITYVSGPHDTP